jgi:hypothetical protein
MDYSVIHTKSRYVYVYIHTLLVLVDRTGQCKHSNSKK